MNRRINDVPHRRGALWKRPALSPAVFLWAGAAGSGSCILLNFLIARIDFLSDPYERAVIQLSGRPFCFRLAAAGIMIPVAEEMVFRGLGYMGLRKWLSFVQAALLSSIGFAVYHGNAAQGVYAFALGFLMAWLCEQYHSLGLSVWFHISANLSAVLLSQTAAVRSWYKGWPVIMVSAGLVFIGLYKIREDVEKREIVIHSNSLL